MGSVGSSIAYAKRPAPRDVLELLKPITWFPPMWAFMCGVVSSGVGLDGRWLFLFAGILLTGPLVCGTSQAVNDWYDRHVDAINQPERPIPSGRIAGNWGWRIAVLGTLLSVLVAWLVGPWVFAAGNLPRPETLIVLLLYSIGAHGIMTLNDFKAVLGDTATGVRSLPVILGVGPAARLACLVMALCQAAVVALLMRWGLTIAAGLVALLLLAQIALMPRLIRNPAKLVPWYAARGVTLYVLGMLAAALGLGGYL
jgi:chlorophyll synthase